MNWDNMGADHWKQVADNLRLRWSRLTAADLEGIAGKREHLIGRLQALYSLTALRAEAELRDWERHQEPIAPAWRQ